MWEQCAKWDQARAGLGPPSEATSFHTRVGDDWCCFLFCCWSGSECANRGVFCFPAFVLIIGEIFFPEVSDLCVYTNQGKGCLLDIAFYFRSSCHILQEELSTLGGGHSVEQKAGVSVRCISNDNRVRNGADNNKNRK